MTLYVRCLLLAALVLLSKPVSAAFIHFTQNPASNSQDFDAGVAASGHSLQLIDFNTHPLGPLLNTFYSGIGVNLAGTGDYTSVQFGSGPNQPGQAFMHSNGEGTNPPSNFLGGTQAGGTLTISFAAPVVAAGFLSIDSLSVIGTNGLAVQVFAGPNGTGALLDSFDSAFFDFQPNFRYFMGVLSTDNNIGSLVVTNRGLLGDIVGLDNIEFASATPEPGTLGSAVTGIIGVGCFALLTRRRRA